MGKIAYGRRRTEKKIGTRNEMHIVEQDEYPIYDGHHEAIISEADWQLAQEKRKANNFKREKVHDIEQTEMNRMVAAIISAMVKDKRFKDAIKAKIGTAVDTSEMEERIEALRTQLKQVQGTKTRL